MKKKYFLYILAPCLFVGGMALLGLSFDLKHCDRVIYMPIQAVAALCIFMSGGVLVLAE